MSTSEQVKNEVDIVLKQIHASDWDAQQCLIKSKKQNLGVSITVGLIFGFCVYLIPESNWFMVAAFAIVTHGIALDLLQRKLKASYLTVSLGNEYASVEWERTKQINCFDNKQIERLLSPLNKILRERDFISTAERTAIRNLLQKVEPLLRDELKPFPGCAVVKELKEWREIPNVLSVDYLSSHGQLMYTATRPTNENVLASIAIYVKTPQDSKDTCSASFTINFKNPYNLGDFDSALEFDTLLSVNDFNVLKAFPRLLDCLSNSVSQSISVDELCSRLDAIGATKGAGHDGILCMWRNLSGVSEQELEDVFANASLNFKFATTKASAPGKGES